MTRQPVPRSQGAAALCLVLVTVSSVAAAAGGAASWPVLILLGAAGGLVGIIGLGVFAYRASRQTGIGVLKALGRTLLVAITLIWDWD